MKKIINPILFALIALLLSTTVYGWSQPTHKQINLEALIKFQTIYANKEKYKEAPIDTTETFLGLLTTSSSLFEKNYKDTLTINTYAGWIVEGGSSADEPHLYESVRHFYDPTKDGNGPTWLTDQITAHGYIYNLPGNGYTSPEIDAKEWGLRHPDNPYSFQKALEYYKKAMTIPENKVVENFIGNGLFRTRDVVANSLDEERSLYLGAAFRALGETMHLMGDMTQPAHVRNDSHPIIEPFEQGLNGSDVTNIAQNNIQPDSRISPIFTTFGAQTAMPVEQLFVSTAQHTNRYFYSADTIYDGNEGIMPFNGEDPYPHPQFSDLVIHEIELKNGLKCRSVYGVFNGVEVPMASQDLMDVILNKEETHEFNVLPSYAKSQGNATIPVAIAACADVIDRFFPTLELMVEAQAEKILLDKKEQEYAMIPVEVQLIHHYQQDPDWSQEMEIKYAGPAELVFEKDGKIEKAYKINFENGVIKEIQEGRKMVEKPLQIYIKKSPKTKLSKEEAYYELQEGQAVYLEIHAGGRIFKKEIDVRNDQRLLEIETSIYAPVRIDDIGFSTELLKDGYYVWLLGDGEIEEGFEANEIEHQYNAEGEYLVQVTCYKDSNQSTVIGYGKRTVEVGDKFEMTILPSNNLEAEVNDEVQIKVTLVDDHRTLSDFVIKWDCAGSTTMQTGADFINLKYNSVGQYDIKVMALDQKNNVVGEGKAKIEIVKGENTPDARLEYYKQFDRKYYPYDYSKFIVDEREGSATIQESNYLGGMKMTFYDKDNTIIKTVKYFRTDVDYTKYSKYTKEDFEQSPHVLADLIRKTEWASDGYNDKGNLVSVTVKMPDDKGILISNSSVIFYDEKFTVRYENRYQEGDFVGKQYYLSIGFEKKFSDRFNIDDRSEFSIYDYENGEQVSAKRYRYVLGYESNMYDEADNVRNYLVTNFMGVEDAGKEERYTNVLNYSKGFYLQP
ncbi:MAG: hypothetical protein JXQ26_01095 [Tissierellales bacterium]|nr:hypothetical protein [Tissierellales bacterium]MBN2826554.1 hypothetical protein [Tissierellales bacterium]